MAFSNTIGQEFKEKGSYNKYYTAYVSFRLVLSVLAV